MSAASRSRDPAVRLAHILTAEAVKVAGGETAWNRLHEDVRLDMVRARAWLWVQARYNNASEAVHVADLEAAMAVIYSGAL